VLLSVVVCGNLEDVMNILSTLNGLCCGGGGGGGGGGEEGY
jgi:hypothetical protein